MILPVTHINTMKTVICFCLLLLLCNYSKAQDIKKSKITVTGNPYEYFEMQSDVPIRGLLILLPAAGEKPKDIFLKTQLPRLLAAQGYVTIIPDIPMQMFADKECIAKLDELLRQKTALYKLRYQDIVIGGLSNGGAVALGYTAYLSRQKTSIKLKATFAIDPPADLSRVYASAETMLKYNCPLIAAEGKRNKSYLDKTLGGSPDSNPEAYYILSSFSTRQPDGGNAKYLKDVPLRLYSEPDLDFVRRTYCPELQFFNLNAYDLEKLIAFVKAAGNQRAAYIKSTGKGFHSWNIVDADDCAKWILGL